MDGSFVLAAIFTILFTLCPKTQAAAELPYYYPQAFRAALQENTDSKRLREILFEVLDKAHLKRINAPDELDENCPSQFPICYRHRPLNYRYARTQLFGDLHLKRQSNQYAIEGVYCLRTHLETDFPQGKTPGPGQIPSPNILNTEHTWPQSKFSTRFPKDLQKGDLHILFPVEMRVNSTRGNHPFGEVSAVLNSPCPLAKKGYSAHSTQVIFEPADEHKGNVARAMFYFSVRYELPIDSDQENFLRRWAHQDPIDEFERQRNEKIFEIQGNRNPFIDHPELYTLIDNF